MMADLDTLIATFQTQLSDVMETVVKTAMFEVTRLVEDNFLQEMKRKTQEVETLRIQLQWAERKISDQEETHRGKTNMDNVELTDESTETSPEGQQDGKEKASSHTCNRALTWHFQVFCVNAVSKRRPGLWNCGQRIKIVISRKPHCPQTIPQDLSAPGHRWASQMRRDLSSLRLKIKSCNYKNNRTKWNHCL